MNAHGAEPLIGLLETVWASLAGVAASLEPSEWDRTTDCPGWSVRDQYAHMIGTESMLAGRAAPGSTDDVRSREHVRNDIGALNEQWVESYRERPGEAVLADFVSVTNERLAALRALTPQEWDAEGFTPEGPGPYRWFMAIRVFDCWYHEQDVREATGRAGSLDNAVADFAVARIPKALPYIVGKKAGAEDGSVVTIVLDSEPITVIVEGRARLADEPAARADVTITTDRRTFARLAGGRWSAAIARSRGSLVISGDAELGERIVSNFGYTI